jgi:VWFA-related protein
MRSVGMMAAGVLVCGGALSAVQNAGQTPAIRSATAGVLIDVSVVDRKGQPVLDLSPHDFELKENGVRQQLTSARLVRTGATSAQPLAPAAPVRPIAAAVTAATTAPASAAPAGLKVIAEPPPISVTAILFDRLTTEARPAARKAALTYLGTVSPPNDYAGMFMTDLSLVTFAPFTNDPKVFRSGLDRMTMTVPSNTRTEVPDPRIAKLLPATPPTVGAEQPAGFTGPDSLRDLAAIENARDSELGLLKLLLRMEKSYRALLDEQNGQASIAGLRAAVEAMRELPGRKTILYFSEALPVTARLKSLLDELIIRANSANVSIYTVDAAGLRVHSQEAEVARELDVAGAQGVGDVPRGDGPWTKDLERQQQVVESRAAAVLGRLANETGGFLISNTNELGAGVARMQQDRWTYYLLAYQSTNPVLDGTFRRVSVKVTRPNVTVRARQGYRATPVTPTPATPGNDK